jgi:cell wall-associated NlpC family hydrolase
LACATLAEPFARSGGATVKKVLFLAAPLALFVAALLGLVILFSTVGGTAQATACTLSTLSTTKTTATKTSATTTTTTLSSNANCGAAAPATLPTSPVINDGLPTNYVIPADATAAETVAITYALAQLGKPYLWGGTGPAAFDCSGLTMMAWAQAGVTLLHYTGDQINEGTAVSSYAEIAPGDLVLVPGSDGTVANPGHVGIYIGDGIVESAVDVQYGVIVQPYSFFISGGLSGIRHVG